MIFQKQAGTQRYTFTERAFDNMVYLAKAVASDSETEGGRKLAGTIAERLDEILTNYALDVSGKTLLNLRKTSDVDYIETDAATGQAIYHVGGLFRLEVTQGATLAVAATATMTFSGVPSNAGEFTLGDLGFQFRSNLSDDTIILTSSNDPATIAALTATQINLFSASTLCTAEASGLLVHLTANLPGAAGNDITVSDDSNHLTITPFTGGSD